MSNIVIAKVLYTISDETFYVLNEPHDNASKYIAETLEDAFYNLKADGWYKCGKVNRAGFSQVDMLTNNTDYIAVWEEPSLSHFEQGKLCVEDNDVPPDAAREYLEGNKKTVTVNTYERNPAARRLCIEHYGAVCSICGFDFGKIYGIEPEGMMHVHHLKMMSKTDGEYIIDPVKDLRPVCPNCHMVLHSRKDGYTIDEVKAMLKI